MTLMEHAMRELKLVGYFRDDASEPDNWIANQVIALIDTFAKQGHSGESAQFCIALFKALASYDPLMPLTGKDDEWEQVGPELWQNKRCSKIFKDQNHAYNIFGRVFKEPNGACYTNGDSWVDVTFPYTVCDPEFVPVEAK